MPVIDSYQQGTPSWVDLTTTDQSGAKAFYQAVFGWSYEDNPIGDGIYYTMARLDGHDVAGISPMPDERPPHMPPTWNTYLTVDDVDATVERVAQAGGSVLAPPFDVMESGRMAVIADPTGAAVSFWQAEDHIGATVKDTPGSITWNECFTDDIETAAKFYDAVIGTSHSSADTGDPEPYTTLEVDGQGVAGFFFKDPEAHGRMPNMWLVYFASADIDDTVKRIIGADGKVLNGPFDTPFGQVIVAQDPQGAVFQAIETKVS